MTKTNSQALNLITEIAKLEMAGRKPEAAQARRTLDDLVWTRRGYPRQVKSAARAAGVRL